MIIAVTNELFWNMTVTNIEIDIIIMNYLMTHLIIDVN